MLTRYCAGCHNEKTKQGDLVLTTLDLDNVGPHAEKWELVARKLRARAMPPPGRPRPTEAGYDALIGRLESSLDRAAAANPDPGRTDTFRRLNRTEYQNAIRDLFDLEVDVSAMLPSDDSSHGFDNISVGGLSPMLLERYLSAAQKISRLAVGTPPRSAGAETVILPGGSHSGRSLRRPAVRHARRRERAPYLPGRWRLSVRAASDARSQRAD